MLSDVGDGEAEARGASRHDARAERCGQGAPRHRLAAHAQAELVAAQSGDSAPLEGSSLLELDLQRELTWEIQGRCRGDVGEI